MSLLQSLAWLAQTVTFTGVAFNILIFPVAFFLNGSAAWAFVATIPITIMAGFTWLVLHFLSSVIVKNNTSKIGWILIAGWTLVHIVVYLINIRDPYDVLVHMMYFNAVYLVVSAILLFIYRKPSQEAIEIIKPRFFHLDIQIALSVGLALLIMTILIIR